MTTPSRAYESANALVKMIVDKLPGPLRCAWIGHKQRIGRGSTHGARLSPNHSSEFASPALAANRPTSAWKKSCLVTSAWTLPWVAIGITGTRR